MTLLRQTVVSAARSWLGTPYCHQSACLGGGADCLGLIRGVWREVVGPEPEVPPAYSRDWSEPQGEERLWVAALRHLRARDVCMAEKGQILLFRMKAGSVAKHLGIQSEIGPAPKFVHAYYGHGVVESALTQAWLRRVVARFDFPLEGL